MSVSTTLRLSPVPSAENLQFYQNNTSSKNNNNNNSSYYYYPQEITEDHEILLKNDSSNYTYTALPSEDTILLERASFITNASASSSPFSSHTSAALALHKSNSYNGMSNIIKPKSTILKQDSVNGRIATSLTDDDINGAASSSTIISFRENIPGEGIAEEDAFLVSQSNAATGGASGSNNSGSSNSNSSLRRGTRSSMHGKSARTNICIRAHAFINRNWYLSYLVPLSILLALMFVAYLTRDYAKRLLYWIETQNPWVIFAIFMLLFILVSFPVVVGYFVLMITSGYLFGCLKGFLTVILGANIGIAIAHVTIRSFRHRIPMHKLIKNETGRAILRVISGPRAFKVVLFTRLTPIPFGIQNAIFGVSSINPRVYHSATFLGLLPAQIINVYLGSTLRSMHEVLNNNGTAATGYISFGVEVICGVALMFWVVQKARKELSETLLSDISTDGKLIDIEV